MAVRSRSIPNSCQLLTAAALVTACLVILSNGSGLTAAQEARRVEPASKIDVDRLARGKYLVEDVAMCGNCHTPRRENGELDRAHRLEGAPLFLQPPRPMPDWPLVAPRLAGLPPGSDAAIITLLTTGLWTNGQPLRQPMPQFHMTRSDAEAVLAYLKSL
jgi:mono/diheme cytochrome c family protein